MDHRAFILYGLLALAGCAPGYILLANPDTRELARCPARTPGAGDSAASELSMEQCARRYEGLGYVRVENLTHEQRARLGIALPR